MIQLSDHFTTRRLLRFTIPSIAMMIFTSIYSIVDGFFVSNFTGKTAFAAVNLIMPLLMILGCIGFMFGTGGSALISKTLGEGDKKKASEIFTEVVVVAFALGIILALLGEIFLRPIAMLLGANGQLLEESLAYARIYIIALPFFILQYEFQCLFVTAEKPKLGLYVTIIAGVTNMVLDALFVGVFRTGVKGAALATAISQLLGGGIPVLYFAFSKNSLLHFSPFKLNKRILFNTCTNGSSELLSNISMSVVGMLYNKQLMKYAGEDGVAAYGSFMYIGMIFVAIFMGYSVGVAPIIGYNYGSERKDEMKNIFSKSMIIISIVAILMFIAGETLSGPLAMLFVGYDESLLALTRHAFKVGAISFLFSGFSIFGSSLFTALNNGLISAEISFLRTLVFQVITITVLPLIFHLDGVWLSLSVSEIIAFITTWCFIIGKRKHYGYF